MNVVYRLSLRLAGLLLFACGAHAAHAATVVCVTDPQELLAQLQNASSTDIDEPYVIHVQEGTYSMSVGIDTFFPPATLAQPTRIEGGYRAPNCSGGHDVDYRKTVFEMNNHVFTLRQFNTDLTANGIELDDVTVRNAYSVSLDAGLWHASCDVCADTPGKITLRDVHITGVQQQVRFYTVKSSTTLTNVLMDHLGHPDEDTCQVRLDIYNDETVAMNHVSVDLSDHRDFCFDVGYDGLFEFFIANSIVWSSDGSAGKLQAYHSGSSDPIYLRLDHSIHRINPLGFDTIQLIDNNGFDPVVDPQWNDPVGGDYGLKAASPAANTGTVAVLGGEPSTDAIGNPRRTDGSAPDRGALESPWTNADLFTVTNTSDAGAGSLRAAITNAHNSSAADVTIRFAIPDPAKPGSGLCPAVIELATQLPDLGSAKAQSLTIDGYTQSPAQHNGDAFAFDGKLCVALAGAGPDYGLRVPEKTVDNANGGALVPNQLSLYLSGIGIGNFRQGVALFGGRDHTIVGNQFGGLMPTTTGPKQLYGFGYAALNIDVPGSSGGLRVGGSDVRDRNVFLNATSFGAFPPATAIIVGNGVASGPSACQIIGNTIGVPADGSQVAATTDFGLQLSGIGCYVSGNRLAGFKKDAIWINGGSYNFLANNVLGLFPYGLDQSSSNAGTGIRINGSHNTIGEPGDLDGDASDYANLVEYMGQAGVVVAGGSGNAIRGNALAENGSVIAAIDLGNDGRSANDAGDADAGPNGRQNFPQVNAIAAAAKIAPGAKNVSVTLAGRLNSLPGPGFYAVDAYYDAEGCAGGGNARQWIGSQRYVYVPQGSTLAAFSLQAIVPDYYAGGALRVTATSSANASYDTSELSDCVVLDTLFRDSFD